MIDARRMEVFTALYDAQLHTIKEPQAIILDQESFAAELQNHVIIFSGSGLPKLQKSLQHRNAIFSNVVHDAGHLSKLSFKAFLQKQFADLAYSEPIYLKEFFTPGKKV